MIKAQELRIGNWIYFAYKYKKEAVTRPCQVISISETNIVVLDKGVSLVSEFEPIPLSPEILLACGFVQKAVMGDTRIAWSNGAFLFFEDDFELSKGLHWLQNWIFFRTNQELIYKPK